MGRGIIKLELESIKELLMLPKNYEVISAAYDHEAEVLDIIVQSESITTRRLNSALTRVTPMYEQKRTENGSIIKLREIHIQG